jgi:hypothetical protein
MNDSSNPIDSVDYINSQSTLDSLSIHFQLSCCLFLNDLDAGAPFTRLGFPFVIIPLLPTSLVTPLGSWSSVKNSGLSIHRAPYPHGTHCTDSTHFMHCVHSTHWQCTHQLHCNQFLHFVDLFSIGICYQLITSNTVDQFYHLCFLSSSTSTFPYRFMWYWRFISSSSHIFIVVTVGILNSQLPKLP